MTDINTDELEDVIVDAVEFRRNWESDSPPENFLKGKSGHAALIFEKPSLRTTASLDTGIKRHGGNPAVYRGDQILTRADGGERESIHDIICVMERFYRFVIARVHNQGTIDQMALHATRASVINALSGDKHPRKGHHPLQAIADVTKISALHAGRVKGVLTAYFGEWNNVSTSLSQAAAMLGMDFVHAGPDDEHLQGDEWKSAARLAADSGSKISFTKDPHAAADGADIFYTDTFVSMGDEKNEKAQLEKYGPYQVTPALMQRGNKKAKFLHCLPAHRGQEVHADVIDGPQSEVWDLAEERMHSAMAVMKLLLKTQ